MLLSPSNLADLTRDLSAAHSRGERVAEFHLDSLQRVLEYTPEDMTVTVEAGIPLGALQKKLAEHGQWLPLDPPRADTRSVGALLATNSCGPRRLGYGTWRDYLIGMRAALPDGTVIKSGGRVVKNVAGFDLCKLLIGSKGSLGVIVEATFKLRPLPEVERFLEIRCDSPAKADALLQSILVSPLTPVVLDLHNLGPGDANVSDVFTLVVGFDGMKEDVEWQEAELRKLGAFVPSNLDHAWRFWSGADGARSSSVLPSRLAEFLRGLSDVPFVARAGDGIVEHRGGAEAPRGELPVGLMKRAKQAYDPKGILPDLKMGA